MMVKLKNLSKNLLIFFFHFMYMQTPGPGTYKVTDPNIFKNRKPIYSMNGRNYIPGDNTLKPGPGAHYPERVSIYGLIMEI